MKLNNRLRGLEWPKYLERDTQLLIDGYFRSGNTFALRAFSVAQPAPVKIACHTHAAATIKLAVKRNIPALILLRAPADTAVSAVLKCSGTN